MRRIFLIFLFLALMGEVMGISLEIMSLDNVTTPRDPIIVKGKVDPPRNASLFVNEKWFDNVSVDAWGNYTYTFFAPEGNYTLEVGYWNDSIGWEKSTSILQIVKNLEIEITLDKYAHTYAEEIFGNITIKYWDGIEYSNYANNVTVYLENWARNNLSQEEVEVIDGIAKFSFMGLYDPGPYFIRVWANDSEIEAEGEAVLVVDWFVKAYSTRGEIMPGAKPVGLTKRFVLVDVNGTNFPAQLRVKVW